MKFATVRRRGDVASAYGRTRDWSACSPHHLLRFCRSLFVLLGTCLDRLVGALFVAKVSFCLNPFGLMVAEISFAQRTLQAACSFERAPI